MSVYASTPFNYVAKASVHFPKSAYITLSPPSYFKNKEVVFLMPQPYKAYNLHPVELPSSQYNVTLLDLQ